MHNHFIVERPSVSSENKVPLLVSYVFLDPISGSLGSESFEAHLSYKPPCLSLLALWELELHRPSENADSYLYTYYIIPSDFCHRNLTNHKQHQGTKKVLQSAGMSSFATWVLRFSENPHSEPAPCERAGGGVPSSVSPKQTHFPTKQGKSLRN